MCDPVSLAVTGAVVGGAVYSDDKARKARNAAEDQARMAESERAAASASAVQSANAKLAADNRRRREQRSLLAQGAPSDGVPEPTLGDQTEPGDAMLKTLGRGRLFSRSTVAQRSTSLLRRGDSGVIYTPRTPPRNQAV